jgi:hypothetical protein
VERAGLGGLVHVGPTLSALERGVTRALLEERRHPDLGVVGGEHLGELVLLDGETLGQLALEPRVDRMLRQTLGEHRAPRELGGALAHPCGQLLRRHDLVDEPDAQRLLGPHLPSRQDHLLGPTRPDQTGQPLRAAAAGNDAEEDLGLAEHGPFGRDAHVAGQSQLAPSAERVPRDGSDGHARDRGDGVESAAERAADQAGLAFAAELGDVGAGSEEPIASGEDDRTGRPGRELPGDRLELAQQSGGQGVHLRVVESDHGDAVVIPLQVDQAVEHPDTVVGPRGAPEWPEAILGPVQRRLLVSFAAIVALALVPACSSDDEGGGATATPETTTTTAAPPISTFEPITGGTDEDGDPLPPPVHATVSVMVRGATTWAPYAGPDLTGLDVDAVAAVAMRIRQIDEVFNAVGVDASFELTYGNAAALCSEHPDVFDELDLHGHEIAAHARTKGEAFRVARAFAQCGIEPVTTSGLTGIADPVGAEPTTLESLESAMAVLSIQDLHTIVGPVRALCESLGLWAPTNSYGTGADTAPWRSMWRDGQPCNDGPGRPMILIDQLPVVPDEGEERLDVDAFSDATTRMDQTLGWAADHRYRTPEELPAPGMFTWGMTFRLDDLIAPVPDPEDEDETDEDVTTETTETTEAEVPPDPRTAPLGEETLVALGEWFVAFQPDVDAGRLIWLTPSATAAILRGT